LSEIFLEDATFEVPGQVPKGLPEIRSFMNEPDMTVPSRWTPHDAKPNADLIGRLIHTDVGHDVGREFLDVVWDA
jgi:hypothetical protein